MANHHDVELVVSGDATLWQHHWGSLSFHSPASTVDRVLGLPSNVLGTQDENYCFSA
jgi:hypothetical protein